MALTAAQLLAVRAEVGTSPSDAELDTLHETLASPAAVAHHVLKVRLAEMRGQAAKMSVDGDISEDFTANMKSLEAQVKGLAGTLAVAAGGGTSSIGRLVRRSTR